MNLIIDFSKELDKKKLFDILKKLKPVKQCIEIKQYRKGRSNNQLRYYFGVVLKTISNETGNDVEALHEYFKKKFNPAEVKFKATGESLIVGGSTAEFDTADMEAYLEQIRIFALSELHILISLPNE
jgi:hypothetical protein